TNSSRSPRSDGNTIGFDTSVLSSWRNRPYAEAPRLGNETRSRGGRARPFRTLTRMIVPDKPTLDGLEAKWGARWERAGTYRFDRSKSRAEVFAIDTPPPTASGLLHV